MTAALVAVAATSPLAPALLALLVRLGLTLPAAGRADVLAAHIIAAELDDYTWRAQQAREIRAHDDLRQAVTRATEEWAIAQIHGALADRHPMTPRSARGIDLIAQWWPAPTLVIGRPPLTLTLQGASL